MFSAISKKDFSFQIFKGIVTAVLVTLVGVLLFAFILSFVDLSGAVIKPVNQFIKLSAVFLGCFFNVKEDGAIVKGGLIGLLSTVFCFLLFCLIAGAFSSWLGFFIDLLFGTAMGSLSGVITVMATRR
ncbi:MAG: TIGR04086 family membrane protein [Clostridia bacterium]|nr:TIGR04086 family membrane protein [Clostridia bacterium]